jgi:O-antigen/teichoic acid export membrane protein
MAILSWIMNLSSRYFIGIIGSTFEAGIFVAAFSIASRPFNMLSGIATNFFRPVLFEATSKGEIIKIKLVFKLWLLTILMAGILLMGIFIFGGKFIADLLLSAEYRSNVSILFFFIGLGYFILAIYQIFENFLFAFKKTKETLYSSIIGTIVFIVCNLLLVTYYSSTGAAISVSIAFGLQLITIIYFYKLKS